VGTEPSEYDGARAADVYASRIDEWVKAEEIGFDGIFFGEHHFTPYSITPSPNLMVAALSQRTKRMRIGIMVNVLPFHDPLRLAEEGAMLDLLTRGRLEFGLGRGVDEQEFLRMKMPYQEARPRFEEGIDLFATLLAGHRSRARGPLLQARPRLDLAKAAAEASSADLDHGAQRRDHRLGGSPRLPDVERLLAPAGDTPALRDVPRCRARGGPRGRSPAIRCSRATSTWPPPTRRPSPKERARSTIYSDCSSPPRYRKTLDALPEDYKYYKEFFRPFVKGGAQLRRSDQCGPVRRRQSRDGHQGTRRSDPRNRHRAPLCWMNFGDLSREHALRSEELFAREVIPRLREEFGAASTHERKGAATV